MKLNQDKKQKKTVAREILEWVLTIAAAVVMAFLIRAFVFEPVRVEGESMDTTLANGEIMFVTKFMRPTGSPFPGRTQLQKKKRPA